MASQPCSGCRHVKEHIASLLPFKVIESITGKPLRIGGVAMAAGMSRNFNVYTPEELKVFAEKLVNAPVYIEHVAVDSAAGKVTKCTYDSVSRCLLYEAEIYDQTIADKVRNGLIQHVSVGADYDALDVVNAKVPHGLFNPELSLVAIPGVPETNVQVLEHLAAGKSGVEKLEEEDLNFIAEKIASKVSEKDSIVLEKLKTEIVETKNKLLESEGKLKTAESACAEAKNQLTDANKTIENLRKQLPGGGLLKDPPVMMPISEALTLVREVLPVPLVERAWGMGPQRLCQDIKRVIHTLEARAGGR
jgi:hypothetical protein